MELHLGADGDITVHGIMFPHTFFPMRSPVPRSLDTLFPLPAGSCEGAAVGGTCDRLEGKREAEATVSRSHRFLLRLKGREGTQLHRLLPGQQQQTTQSLRREAR